MATLTLRNGVLGIDGSEHQDLLNGVKAVKHANSAYTEAEQYYNGTRPEWFASMRYRLALARTGTTYRMNFAKTPVDAVVDRLAITSINAGDNATTGQLMKVLNANQFDLEAPEIHKRACEFGDAYLLIWPNDDLGEDPDDQTNNDTELGDNETADDGSEQTDSSIDMYYNDPRTMRVFYDEENPREKKFVIKRWKVGEKYRVNLYYQDRIEKWVSLTNGKEEEAAGWNHFDDGTGIWPTPNPWGKIPVFHFRTDRPYGTPEHINAYGAQDAITKIVITHMTTMDYHGFPQRYALLGGDLDDDNDMEDFGLGDDSDGGDEDEGINTAGGNNRTTVSAEPGSLWLLKNVKGVGQFDAAKSDVFLNPFETYVRAMAQLTTTPLHYFDPSGGTPSGESLRVADAPMVKKVINRQLSFGATWQDAGEFILTLLGHPASEGTVRVSWESPAAHDDLLTWDVAMYKRALGVPVWQIFLEAGYTPEQLTLWGVPQPNAGYDPQVVAVGGKGLPALRQATSTSL